MYNLNGIFIYEFQQMYTLILNINLKIVILKIIIL